VVRLLDSLANFSFGALLGLWLVGVFACGVAYWLLSFWRPVLMENGAPVAATLDGLATSLYFSFITATSVGYGDVAPIGLARALAVTESAAGLLVFGCIISKLVSRRQEQLVEEIHDLAFEDRLGRVRTNLHLVLAELQTLSGECSAAGLPPERLLPRVESTAMVFSGELRAIHDLLYLPRQTPEEAVVEVLLANLAAALKALTELLARFPEERVRSSLLRSSLGSIGSLASEICGDCVPREHAPELKGWMDRIHDLAEGLLVSR
jgi:potassium channel LctB